MHSFGPFCAAVPTAVLAQCRASMFRFARAEVAFLKDLKAEVIKMIGDHLTLVGVGLSKLPCAGIQDPPILENLLDALKLEGPFAAYENLVRSAPDLDCWMLELICGCLDLSLDAALIVGCNSANDL